MSDLTYLYPDEPIEPHDKAYFDRDKQVDMLRWFNLMLRKANLDYASSEVMPGFEEDRSVIIKVAALTKGPQIDTENQINYLCKFIEIYNQPMVLSRLTYASHTRMSNTVWLEFSVTTNPAKYRLPYISKYTCTVTI